MSFNVGVVVVHLRDLRSEMCLFDTIIHARDEDYLGGTIENFISIPTCRPYWPETSYFHFYSFIYFCANTLNFLFFFLLCFYVLNVLKQLDILMTSHIFSIILFSTILFVKCNAFALRLDISKCLFLSMILVNRYIIDIVAF